MSKKDWTGNKDSIFAPLASSNHSEKNRIINDYYATDPKTIDYLFKIENFSDIIWECACGEGHLSKRMEHLGKKVISTDLIDRKYGEYGIDFLMKIEGYDGADIITNPPYKYAQEFVEKAMELTNNKVAMFLKLTFLEGQKRRKMFDVYPPKTVYVFSQRQKCAPNGNFDAMDSSAVSYAWFVWEKGFKGITQLKWI
jgi:hypothetical protein